MPTHNGRGPHAPAKAPDADRVFQALGDATRRAMLERLGARPVAASSLAQPLGITLAAVVQHLAVLEASGLIHSEKQGRVRLCRLEPKGFEVAEGWIAGRKAFWERRLDRLGTFLDDE